MPGIFGREESRYRRNSSNLGTFIGSRCSSPRTLDDDEGDGNGTDYEPFVRKIPYNKLPQQLFRLSVLKLDGSLFDIQVTRNATVADLKQGVEEVFISSHKEGPGTISWSHVWGHFCLCYEGQKLINDKASIKNFGIQDGDQLEFIRHLSINHSSLKKQSKSFSVASKRWSSGSNARDVKEYSPLDDNYENDGDNLMPEFKLAQFLKGWLSYAKLRGASRSGSESRNRPSRFAMQCLGQGRSRMISL